MNAIPALSFASHANVFGRALSLDDVRHQAPAVFATSAHERLSSKYTFIPTARILGGLMQAGFVPVDARQTLTRSASPEQLNDPRELLRDVVAAIDVSSKISRGMRAETARCHSARCDAAAPSVPLA